MVGWGITSHRCSFPFFKKYCLGGSEHTCSANNLTFIFDGLNIRYLSYDTCDIAYSIH